LASLEEYLKDVRMYQLLLEYSNTRFVGENIAFLRAELEYENYFIQSATATWEIYKTNHPTFCISNATREALQKQLQRPEIDMFQMARSEISTFLVNKILPSFLKAHGDKEEDRVNQIHSILRDPKQRKKFMSTARKLGASEEVSFWCVVEQWEDDIFKHALSLWDKYISSESLSQINISASTRKNLKQRIAVPKVDSFVEAKEEISLLVILEVLPGFESWLATKKEIDPDVPSSSETELPVSLIRSHSLDSGFPIGTNLSADNSKNKFQQFFYLIYFLRSTVSSI